jgi:hypothetical protein
MLSIQLLQVELCIVIDVDEWAITRRDDGVQGTIFPGDGLLLVKYKFHIFGHALTIIYPV